MIGKTLLLGLGGLYIYLPNPPRVLLNKLGKGGKSE